MKEWTSEMKRRGDFKESIALIKNFQLKTAGALLGGVFLIYFKK